MIEKLWSTGEYETWLETKNTKQSVGVHRALIRWSDGVVRDSHVKLVFSDESKPTRHLIHEAVAWLFGKSLKLPVPHYAGLIILTQSQISRAHPERPKAGEAAAWVTSTEPVKMLSITEGMNNDEHLKKELLKWDNLCAACAFDEWLANTDRYPRNLLRRGENDFVLIDHDYIAGGPTWLPDMLVASKYDEFSNVLREMCSPRTGGDPTPYRQFSNAMVLHSESYPGTVVSEKPVIDDWLKRLIDDDADVKALIEFISDRANAAQNLIRKRYKLLL